MKHILSSIFGLILVIQCNAQITAVTSNGDEVVLNYDGTWKYADKNDSISLHAIDTNKVNFVKPKESGFNLKSKKTNIAVNFNPQKWILRKEALNVNAEYSFQLKNEDAFGVFIAERTEIKIEDLKTIAFEHAKKIAPESKILKEEYRKVNGHIVLCTEITGNIKGINFIYFSYYLSTPNGSVQFVTFTSQSLFKRYKNDMENLLNGIDIQD